MKHRAATSLTSQLLLRSVIRAFGASREGSRRVTCVLRDRTVRGGLAGRCRPRHWCCPLSAFLEFLIEERLVTLEGLPAGLSPRLALFVALAIEMHRWDAQSGVTRLSAEAHLRARALDFTLRLGALIAIFAPRAVHSPLFASTPAWADRSRRAEPLLQLRELAQFPTAKRMAKRIGNHEQTHSRWRKRATRPRKQSLAEFAQALAPYVDEEATQRHLRWHYALSTLAEQVEAVCGPEFVKQLAAVFCAAVRCSATHFRKLARDRWPNRAGSHAMLIWTSTVLSPDLPWQERLKAIEQHGATPEWRRDVQGAVEEYGALGFDESPGARVKELLGRMPRAKRPREHR